MKNILNDPDLLSRLLSETVSQSVSETYGSLLENEQARQDDLKDDLRGLKSSDNKKEEVEEAEDEEEKAGKEEPVVAKKKPEEEEKVVVDKEETEAVVLTPEEIGELEVDDVVAQIDSLRSGKSLKDDVIRQQFNDYYDRLTGDEKKSLFAFLQGLSQIMVANVPGSKAPDPGTYKIRTGAEVAMKAEKKPQQQRTVSNVKKAPVTDDGPPIVVGECANKTRERRRLRELRRG